MPMYLVTEINKRCIIELVQSKTSQVTHRLQRAVPNGQYPEQNNKNMDKFSVNNLSKKKKEEVW